jgi:pyruvate/2-oxoglutarate dehydrogenase complex dihydrolipoamide dehydrogenase (E3) component
LPSARRCLGRANGCGCTTTGAATARRAGRDEKHEPPPRATSLAFDRLALPVRSQLENGTFAAARHDRILGFAMLGTEAGKAMVAVRTAMPAGMRYAGLRETIIVHPTMTQGLVALFSKVPDR